jgi:hypothetical protein
MYISQVLQENSPARLSPHQSPSITSPSKLLPLLLLLHLPKIIRHIHALLNRRPLLNVFHPKFDFRVRGRFDARPLAPVDPAEDADVAESEFVADEVGGGGGGEVVRFALRGEAVVEDLVEAVGFGLIAVYRVGDFFGGVC